MGLFANFLVSVVAFGLLLIVIYKGRLSSSSFFIPVLLASFGIVVGSLFKIQHWNGATYLLIASGLLFIGLYGVWFARKTQRQRLDWLKLAYVVAIGLFSIALGVQWRPALLWLSGLAQATQWAVVLDFVYVTYIRRPAQPPVA